jgi:cytochrome P450
MAVDVSRRFVLRSGETWANPFDDYRWLRDEDPVHHVVPDDVPEDDWYVLSRHDDVAAAASDPDTFSSAHGLTVTYGELESIGMADNPPMVMLDPPDHTRFRSLVARGFTPTQVRDVEPHVRDFVRDRLRTVAPGDELDLVDHLAKPLPSMVVAHYLGVPESDRDRFDGWTEAIVGADPSGDLVGAMQTAGAAVGEMLGYFTELIERRRVEPGDDTVSHLVAAGVGDDPQGLLSILAFTFTMVAGGNDTTTGLLGGAVDLLASHPDQRDELADDPTLIPAAVEEFLRLTSPVQGLARTTTTDVTLHGVSIPAGRKVLLLYASANRDERRWGADADRLDVHRDPRQVMTFSRGNHHCLGAAAARMQGRVAVEELLATHRDLTVDSAAITWARGNYVRRPTCVPVRLGSR